MLDCLIGFVSFVWIFLLRDMRPSPSCWYQRTDIGVIDVKWAVVYWYSLVQFLIMADLLVPWRFSVFDGWKLLLTNHCASQAKILILIKQILELEFVSSFAKGWWFTIGSVFHHHSSADHFNISEIFIKYSRLQPKTPFLLHSFLPGNCNFSLVTW